MCKVVPAQLAAALETQLLRHPSAVCHKHISIAVPACVIRGIDTKSSAAAHPPLKPSHPNTHHPPAPAQCPTPAGTCLNRAVSGRHTLQLGVDVREIDSWGIDCYTRRNIHDGAPPCVRTVFPVPVTGRLGAQCLGAGSGEEGT